MPKLKKNRHYRHRDFPGVDYFYKINYLDDLLDRKRNYSHEFTSLREIFDMESGREREAIKKAKPIVNDLMLMIAHDLIENNDFFVFPAEKFGYMKIRLTRKEDGIDYPFWFETNGDYYTMRIIIDPRITDRTGKEHLVQISQKLRKRLDEKILIEGFRYS